MPGVADDQVEPVRRQEEDHRDDHRVQRVGADEEWSGKRSDCDEGPQRQPQIAASDLERLFSEGSQTSLNSEDPSCLSLQYRARLTAS